MSRADVETASSKKRKATSQSADALDDGLEYEVDSDAAGDVASISGSDSASDRDDDDNDDVSDDNAAASTAQKDANNDGDGLASSSVTKKKSITPEQKKQKRKLRHEQTKKRKLEELGDDSPASATTAFTNAQILNVDQQADLIARIIRDSAPKNLTSVELSDRYLPASSFIDTSSFNLPRTLNPTAAQNHEQGGREEAGGGGGLLAFLKRFSPREDLASANKEAGRPHTLVLSPSAIRVADVVRCLKVLNSPSSSTSKSTSSNFAGGAGGGSGGGGGGKKGGKKGSGGEVAKLFGKEKVSDQARKLETTRINVAVGVPGRVKALLSYSPHQQTQDVIPKEGQEAGGEREGGEEDSGALKVSRLERIIIEFSYRDSKNRTIFQIKEIVRDLVDILGHVVLRKRIAEGSCKVLLF